MISEEKKIQSPEEVFSGLHHELIQALIQTGSSYITITHISDSTHNLQINEKGEWSYLDGHLWRNMSLRDVTTIYAWISDPIYISLLKERRQKLDALTERYSTEETVNFNDAYAREFNQLYTEFAPRIRTYHDTFVVNNQNNLFQLMEQAIQSLQSVQESTSVSELSA